MLSLDSVHCLGRDTSNGTSGSACSSEATSLYCLLMPSSFEPVPFSSRLSDAQVSEIVALVGRGLTARQIRARFPTLEPGAVRAALLQAAELLKDEDLSLRAPSDSVAAIVSRAQRNAAMSEAEAVELAVEETRAERRERTERR